MTTKNVRDLLPGELVVAHNQAPLATTTDTDPKAVQSLTVQRTGVTVTFADGMSEEYEHDDDVEVAAPMPGTMALRWRGSQQRWVMAISTPNPAFSAVVEINGHPVFDGVPKPIPTVDTGQGSPMLDGGDPPADEEVS